jgi:hypothetical protein
MLNNNTLKAKARGVPKIKAPFGSNKSREFGK